MIGALYQTDLNIAIPFLQNFCFFADHTHSGIRRYLVAQTALPDKNTLSSVFAFAFQYDIMYPVIPANGCHHIYVYALHGNENKPFLRK